MRKIIEFLLHAIDSLTLGGCRSALIFMVFTKEGRAIFFRPFLMVIGCWGTMLTAGKIYDYSESVITASLFVILFIVIFMWAIDENTNTAKDSDN